MLEEKKPPPTAVNKIRGGKSTSTSSLYSNLGGFGTATTSSMKNTGGFGFDGGIGNNSNANDPYGFDLDAPLKPKKDPYAFDLDAADSKDPYAFDLDADADLKTGMKKNLNAKKTKNAKGQYDFTFDDKKIGKDAFLKKNKFAGSSGLGGPLAYNDEEEDDDDGYGF